MSARKKGIFERYTRHIQVLQPCILALAIHWILHRKALPIIEMPIGFGPQKPPSRPIKHESIEELLAPLFKDIEAKLREEKMNKIMGWEKL